ncbi:hypothetical protein NBG4_420003 [Candidatus Sulfobium mesophilum]|uniref:Uncharacterized protein n=1 Tax=Candidatus Sulfobium mesophilum TaxID=2016548 RepID=A0A2U3QI84_9BACT|nr:hypothetical protein NBG4_420003 [Candidatus Sulfobium mesophilum]
MTRTSGRHRNYEIDKMGRINVYPSLEEPKKGHILRYVGSRLVTWWKKLR